MQRELGCTDEKCKDPWVPGLLQYIILDHLQTWALLFKYSWCYWTPYKGRLICWYHWRPTFLSYQTTSHKRARYFLWNYQQCLVCILKWSTRYSLIGSCAYNFGRNQSQAMWKVFSSGRPGADQYSDLKTLLERVPLFLRSDWKPLQRRTNQHGETFFFYSQFWHSYQLALHVMTCVTSILIGMLKVYGLMRIIWWDPESIEWFIEDQAFSSSYARAPPPSSTPRSPVSKLSLFRILPVFHLSSRLTWEGGRWRRMSQIIRRRESQVLYLDLTV